MAFVVYSSKELTSLVVLDAEIEESYLLAQSDEMLDQLAAANRYVADSVFAYDVFSAEETLDGVSMKVVVTI